VHEIPFSQPKISKSQFAFYPFRTLNNVAGLKNNLSKTLWKVGFIPVNIGSEEYILWKA
jgi:hypothetical protein